MAYMHLCRYINVIGIEQSHMFNIQCQVFSARLSISRTDKLDGTCTKTYVRENVMTQGRTQCPKLNTCPNSCVHSLATKAVSFSSLRENQKQGAVCRFQYALTVYCT